MLQRYSPKWKHLCNGICRIQLLPKVMHCQLYLRGGKLIFATCFGFCLCRFSTVRCGGNVVEKGSRTELFLLPGTTCNNLRTSTSNFYMFHSSYRRRRITTMLITVWTPWCRTRGRFISIRRWSRRRRWWWWWWRGTPQRDFKSLYALITSCILDVASRLLSGWFCNTFMW